MKKRYAKHNLLASILLVLILISTLCLSSCNQPPVNNNGSEGTGNVGDGENKDKEFGPISYGSEYLYTSGDISVDTRLSAGRSDIITDKHLVFTAGVKSFEGLRLGHGYEDYTGSYIEIDRDFIKYYLYKDEAQRISAEFHGLNIQGDLKVKIDVDNYRVATINLESGEQSFTFTANEWYGSNGEIFAESLGSVLTGAQLAFTCDGYADDVQFYGDSYLSQSSNGWLKFAFADGHTNALFDGFGGRGSNEAYLSLSENLKHSSPDTVVWMMGMNDGSDTDINTPSSTWSESRDKLIALAEEYAFEIVFTTIPTVPTINHEAKNKWIRESGYRYIDMAAALGADGTGEWTEGYLNPDGVHPSIPGARAIYDQVMYDLYGIESDTLGAEYKEVKSDMKTDTKISLGKADINTDKHLIFSAEVESFEGLRIGHGHSSYTSDYIEIDATYVKHYQRMSETKMLKSVEHGLDIKDHIKVTIDTGIDNSATICIESNGKSCNIPIDTWYGCSGEIFAESLGSILPNAHLAFTCDGYGKDIQFYGDSYIFVWSPGRWPYYAFKDGYSSSALYDGFGGRGSSEAFRSLSENIKHSSPKIVVWMMGMNDGSDPDANTPCQDWATNRDKLIALSKECGFEIVFATIPTVPTRYHEAKNKWIRESGYRYIDVAAGLGADGTGKWSDGYLSGDGVHPSNAGGAAIYIKIVEDLPEFTKARDEENK